MSDGETPTFEGQVLFTGTVDDNPIVDPQRPVGTDSGEVPMPFDAREAPLTRGVTGVGLIDPRTAANVGSVVRTAACVGADFVFTTNDTGAGVTACGHDGHTPLFTDATVDVMVPVDADLIAIEYTDRSVPLSRFVHPERAVYVAGNERHGVPVDVLDRADATVHLDTKWCENVATATAVVLHDRAASIGGGR